MRFADRPNRPKGRVIFKEAGCNRGFAQLPDNGARLLYLMIAIQTFVDEEIDIPPQRWPEEFDLMDFTPPECIRAQAHWIVNGLAEPSERGIVLTADFLGPTSLGRGSWIREGERHKIYKRDGYACRYCGATEPLSLDHVKPRAQGGSDDPENLVTACRSCNSRKNARTPQEAGMPLSPLDGAN